jgi:ATP-dependent helicase/nuclease subunit B
MEQKAHPDKEIVCAGAFYFSFQDPIVEMAGQGDMDELEDAVISEMRVKGLVNGRPDVVDRLDRDRSPGPSMVIPVTRNKNPEELRAGDHVITDRQFELLRSYARGKMRQIASSILTGQIAPNPSRTDARTQACTWCPYRDVCRFDPRQKGMAYREREKRSSQENWEIIESAFTE